MLALLLVLMLVLLAAVLVLLLFAVPVVAPGRECARLAARGGLGVAADAIMPALCHAATLCRLMKLFNIQQQRQQLGSRVPSAHVVNVFPSD